jgi:hypothetical protein
MLIYHNETAFPLFPTPLMSTSSKHEAYQHSYLVRTLFGDVKQKKLLKNPESLMGLTGGIGSADMELDGA